jgi:3-dehydroquinate dehydratase-2
VALLDALMILEIPVVEVHLTNVYKREESRHSLLTAKASTIIMLGSGEDSYYLAIYSQYIKRKGPHVSNN